MATIDPPEDGRAFDLPIDELTELLAIGDMEIEGRMPYSSNATLLVTMTKGDASHRAIYKPGQGERPLWDFPDGLYKREVAMFELSDQLGFEVIPPTLLVDAELGPGSLQAFVKAHFSEHYFTMMEEGVGGDDLRQLCVLDLIGNNTDRKAGHCLLGGDGRIYGIDHGLAFHAQFKLRTVMWDFVDEEIPAASMEAIARFVDTGPRDSLARLLDTFEVDAMIGRARAVLDEGRFPEDDTGGQRYPWPLV
jgi:uncharacterized repeat protein (TIGR03843 family)